MKSRWDPLSRVSARLASISAEILAEADEEGVRPPLSKGLRLGVVRLGALALLATSAILFSHQSSPPSGPPERESRAVSEVRGDGTLKLETGQIVAVAEPRLVGDPPSRVERGIGWRAWALDLVAQSEGRVEVELSGRLRADGVPEARVFVSTPLEGPSYQGGRPGGAGVSRRPLFGVFARRALLELRERVEGLKGELFGLDRLSPIEGRQVLADARLRYEGRLWSPLSLLLSQRLELREQLSSEVLLTSEEEEFLAELRELLAGIEHARARLGSAKSPLRAEVASQVDELLGG